MNRPSWATVTLLVVAAGSSVAVLHPWQEGTPANAVVSSRSGTVRVFPGLIDIDPAKSEITLQASDGVRVRLAVGNEGHDVWRNDTLLGPADPQAFTGLWESLVMATTLRAADAAAHARLGSGGMIVVHDGDHELRVRLGSPSPDGVGVYAQLGDGDVNVVEPELATILAQEDSTWLLHRIASIAMGDVQRVAQPGIVLERGADGLWRSHVEGQRALLSTLVVETRLDRLLSARLDPWIERERFTDAAFTPWWRIEAGGKALALRLGPPCPGAEDKRIVERGAGWLGCLDEALVQPWEIPGHPASTPTQQSRWIEPDLLPYDEGRILAVEQLQPQRRRLRREGGGWLIEETAEGLHLSVPEPEVFRWLTRLRETEVELVAPADQHDAAPFESTELVFETDSTVHLRVLCRRLMDEQWCRRDEGPWLRIRKSAELPPLAFDASTFADRRLLSLAVDDVRALEILPGPSSSTVRQSAHLDLGVWRLDAPMLPAGAGDPLDDIRLVELLTRASSAMVDDVVPRPKAGPVRLLRFERTPASGREAVLEVELFDGCIAGVAAREVWGTLPPSACTALQQDLLFVDPLRDLLRRANACEVRTEQGTERWSKQGELWVDTGGSVAGDQSWMTRIEDWRSLGIRAGAPTTPSIATLRFALEAGPAVLVSLGRTWARFDDAAWYYVRNTGT